MCTVRLAEQRQLHDRLTVEGRTHLFGQDRQRQAGQATHAVLAGQQNRTHLRVESLQRAFDRDSDGHFLVS